MALQRQPLAAIRTHPSRSSSNTITASPPRDAARGRVSWFGAFEVKSMRSGAVPGRQIDSAFFPGAMSCTTAVKSPNQNGAGRKRDQATRSGEPCSCHTPPVTSAATSSWWPRRSLSSSQVISSRPSGARATAGSLASTSVALEADSSKLLPSSPHSAPPRPAPASRRVGGRSRWRRDRRGRFRPGPAAAATAARPRARPCSDRSRATRRASSARPGSSSPAPAAPGQCGDPSTRSPSRFRRTRRSTAPIVRAPSAGPPGDEALRAVEAHRPADLLAATGVVLPGDGDEARRAGRDGGAKLTRSAALGIDRNRGRPACAPIVRAAQPDARRAIAVVAPHRVHRVVCPHAIAGFRWWPCADDATLAEASAGTVNGRRRACRG